MHGDAPSKKVVLVTGGGRGLGRETGIAFSLVGWSVVLAARTKTEVDAVASEISQAGGRASGYHLDVRDPVSVQEVFARLDAQYGRLDALINNAGVATFGPLATYDVADLADMFETNTLGCIRCAQAACARMRRQGSGHIVNIVSTSGRVGRANETAYAASKWALVGFTECLRLELENTGIKVSAVFPGGMRTSFWSSSNAQRHQPDTSRFMDPAEVASAVVDAVSRPRVAVTDLVIRRTLF